MLKLYRPLKNAIITQGFGEQYTMPNLLPKYQEMGLKGHNGWDFMASDGDDIRFNGSGRGRVIETSLDIAAGLGVVVFVEGIEKSYKMIYWHLKNVLVNVGQEVESGDLLGLADNTGWSTGTHLHFGLKECDKYGITINRGNGYDGAIDPSPYFENYYILDLKQQLQGQMVVLLQKVLELLRQLLWRKF